MSRNKSSQFDQELEMAYQKAVYRIFTPPLHWKIGVDSPEMDAFLHSNNVMSAVFVSACNPYSQILSVVENQKRTKALAKWIEDQQLPVIPGQGEDPAGKWPPEPSFLLPGFAVQQGKIIGQQWQQNAVVLLRLNRPAELLWCL